MFKGIKNPLFQSETENVIKDGSMFDMTELGPRSSEPESESTQESSFRKRMNDSKMGKIFREFKVLILALLHAFFAALTVCLLKLSFTLVETEHLIVRYVVQILIMIGIIYYKKLGIKRTRLETKWIVIRSIFGVSEVVVGFFALRMLDPGNFNTLMNISMITTAFIARLILKEKLSSIHFVATVFAFAGIICIVRPPFLFGHEDVTTGNRTRLLVLRAATAASSAQPSQNATLGVLLVIVTALFLSFEFISNKQLANFKVHYSLVLFYPSLIGLPCGVIISSILLGTHESHQNFKDESHLLALHIFYSFLSAFSSVASNIFLNLAIKFGEATKIAIIRTTSVLFTILIELVLLGIRIQTLDAIGTLLIMTAILGIIIYQYIEKKLTTSNENKSKCVEIVFRKF